RALTEIRHPDLRNNSRVCSSRLPFGRPSFSTLTLTLFEAVIRRGLAGAFLVMAVAGAIPGGIDLAFFRDRPLPIFEHAEEARLVTFMAGGLIALLIDAEHDRVFVAVDTNLADDLRVAGLLALAPQPFT